MTKVSTFGANSGIIIALKWHIRYILDYLIPEYVGVTVWYGACVFVYNLLGRFDMQESRCILTGYRPSRLKISGDCRRWSERVVRPSFIKEACVY